jgi:hypothetical protein
MLHVSRFLRVQSFEIRKRPLSRRFVEHVVQKFAILFSNAVANLTLHWHRIGGGFNRSTHSYHGFLTSYR